MMVEHMLKALLKSMIESSHYRVVATHVIAKKIGVETHAPIEGHQCGVDELHGMLDEAIPDAECGRDLNGS